MMLSFPVGDTLKTIVSGNCLVPRKVNGAHEHGTEEARMAIAFWKEIGQSRKKLENPMTNRSQGKAEWGLWEMGSWQVTGRVRQGDEEATRKETVLSALCKCRAGTCKNLRGSVSFCVRP